MNFIIAQVFGVLGSLAVMFASQMKDKRKYLMLYTFAYLFFIVNMTLLKSYAGALNNFLTMILTVISMKFEDKKFPIWIVILFGVTILFGNILTYQNIFSLLPCVASVIYLIILLSKDMRRVRGLTVGLRLMWGIYDFCVRAYSTFVFDIISFILSVLSVYRFDIKKLEENI